MTPAAMEMAKATVYVRMTAAYVSIGHGKAMDSQQWRDSQLCLSLSYSAF